MSNTAHGTKNSSPIIEIVEWLNDDGELISSFTKDLSLSQDNLDKALPSNNESRSPGSLDLNSSQTDKGKDLKTASFLGNDVVKRTRPSNTIKKADDPSSNNVKARAVKKVQFEDNIKNESEISDKVDLLLQPARVLRFRQRLNGYEPTLNRFSNTSNNTLKNDESLQPVKSSDMNVAEGASEIDHDFETVLLDLKHEQAKKLNLDYKTRIYQNGASKGKYINPSSESKIVEKPDIEAFALEDDTCEVDEVDENGDPDAHLYFPSDDLDQLVRDYDLGLFDDDSKQNVVEKLEDFEQLNAILEAAQKDLELDEKNTEMEVLEDSSASIFNSVTGKMISELSDFDVMANDVIENEVADDIYDEEAAFFDYDEVEKNVLDQDIKLNYFRLKRKLYPTRVQDEEIEEL